MTNFGFPKKLRLLTQNQFTFVFQKPQLAGISKITILGRQNSLGYPRIGFAIAKKNIKHAHERNHIKRLSRESFRLHQHKLPGMDFVVIVKKGVTDLDNRSFKKRLEKLWHQHARLFHRS